MISFSRPFANPALEESALSLYGQLVAQARQPSFYLHCGVPDSFDGRFELVALHTFLILYRLKSDEEKGDALGQTLLDVLFRDFDRNIREMGVGDLSVGKEVKKMARALLGRIAAYDSALQVGERSSSGNIENDQLAGALRRNLYGTVKNSGAYLPKMTAYVRREAAAMSVFPLAELLAGKCRFGPSPAL